MSICSNLTIESGLFPAMIFSDIVSHSSFLLRPLSPLSFCIVFISFPLLFKFVVMLQRSNKTTV